ncbi:MAG: hypothetical protein ABSD31_18020 [Candidatus Binataceae bacterium]|jgi:chemotaxis protein MotB
MTSLAVIFILLLVATTQHTVMEAAAAKRKGQNTRDSLLAELKKELSGMKDVNFEPQNDPLTLLIVVPEKLVFKTGDWNLSPDGKVFLGQFMGIVAGVACGPTFKEQLTSIVVEGHTDSSWRNPGPEGIDVQNLSLSQKRSMEVVKTSLSITKGISDALNSCFLKFVSASGRGSSEPIVVDGKENPEKSRRVVFKIRVQSFEEQNIVQTGEAAMKTLKQGGVGGLFGHSHGN